MKHYVLKATTILITDNNNYNSNTSNSNKMQTFYNWFTMVNTKRETKKKFDWREAKREREREWDNLCKVSKGNKNKNYRKLCRFCKDLFRFCFVFFCFVLFCFTFVQCCTTKWTREQQRRLKLCLYAAYNVWCDKHLSLFHQMICTYSPSPYYSKYKPSLLSHRQNYHHRVEAELNWKIAAAVADDDYDDAGSTVYIYTLTTVYILSFLWPMI